MAGRILGVDVSTRHTGLVLIPSNYFDSVKGPDWSMVWALTVELDSIPKGALENTRVRRLDEFDRRFREALLEMDPDYVWFEQYAFGDTGAYAKLTAEITGAAKLAVLRGGFSVNVVASASARKLLLGKVPRGKGQAKQAVKDFMRDLHAPWADDDNCCDAFAVANYGMSELGYQFVGAS